MFLYRLKFNTFAVLLLSVAFIWFFYNCKHDLLSSEVNVFNIDPFDAVESVSIQVSFVTTFFSLLRCGLAFFAGEIPDVQNVFIAHGNIVSLLSITVILISDIFALIRFKVGWIYSVQGIRLAAMITLFLIFAVMMFYRSFGLKETKHLKVAKGRHEIGVFKLLRIFNYDETDCDCHLNDSVSVVL
jgi:hypothetical protein